MTLLRATTPLAVALAVTMVYSTGCVRRTIVRDRSAATDTRPSDINVNKTDPHVHPAAPAHDPTVVVVQPSTPPPAAPVEVRPAPPAPPSEYVWVDGKYEWRNNRWEWTPGFWRRS
jgi:hypothetical protein